MIKKALGCTMLLGVVFSLPAAADDPILKFKGGIGVIPTSSVTCSPSVSPSAPSCTTSSTVSVTATQNFVRGQTPGGQIWVIRELDAEVSANGNITVHGKGLLLGGGNSAGGVPAGLSVFATLSCSSTGTFGLSSTNFTGVAVSANGNFQINGTLSPTPTFPSCTSPLLLIQSTAMGHHWFALGIVSSGP